MTRTLASVWLFAMTSCTGAPDHGPPEAVASTLPQGVVASVGSMTIAGDTIARISSRLQVPPRTALENEIRTALFAAAALHRGYEAAPLTRAALRGRLARAALERLGREARQTEVNETEVAQATARHFVELDRPEGFRVVHALVQLRDNADAATKARAKTLADRIAERVAPAIDADDFRKRAEATPDRADFELVVETLKPVASDGRVIDLEHPSSEPERYALPFARAASRLGQPGQKSGVVSTEFGFHVLMLLDRTPAKFVPYDERKAMLEEEILTERAKRLKRELLERLTSASPPRVERSADALLATAASAAEQAGLGRHEAP